MKHACQLQPCMQCVCCCKMRHCVCISVSRTSISIPQLYSCTVSTTVHKMTSSSKHILQSVSLAGCGFDASDFNASSAIVKTCRLPIYCACHKGDQSLWLLSALSTASSVPRSLPRTRIGATTQCVSNPSSRGS